MIAPSPDWIIGVSKINMKKNGGFREIVDMDMYAYDAGTEEGDNPGNYSTSNMPTFPPNSIRKLSGIIGLDKPFGKLVLLNEEADL